MSHELYVECSFLIPIRRDANLSDGKLQPPKTWKWLDLELYRRFGGGTMSPGHVGFYTDPDTKAAVYDESRKYTVAIAKNKVDELRKLLSACCVICAQKCIYLSVAGNVEFIEPP